MKHSVIFNAIYKMSFAWYKSLSIVWTIYSKGLWSRSWTNYKERNKWKYELTICISIFNSPTWFILVEEDSTLQCGIFSCSYQNSFRNNSCSKLVQHHGLKKLPYFSCWINKPSTDGIGPTCSWCTCSAYMVDSWNLLQKADRDLMQIMPNDIPCTPFIPAELLETSTGVACAAKIEH